MGSNLHICNAEILTSLDFIKSRCQNINLLTIFKQCSISMCKKSGASRHNIKTSAISLFIHL